jgi:hypothetical protein
MNKRLKEYALIAEIIGAAAIVVSLLFVGQELRQSNRLASAESLRAGTQVWIKANAVNFGSEESTAFMRKAFNEYESLSKDEKGRFYVGIIEFVAAFDTLHNQYEAGFLREETYISIALSYYSLIKMPGTQKLFKETVTYLAPYLLDPADNDAMTGREEDFPPWPFLQN